MLTFDPNQLFDLAPNGILIAREGRLVYCNPAGREMLFQCGVKLEPEMPLPEALAELPGQGSAAFSLGGSRLLAHTRPLDGGTLYELQPIPTEEALSVRELSRISQELRGALFHTIGSIEQLKQSGSEQARREQLSLLLKSSCQTLRIANSIDLMGALTDSSSFSMEPLNLQALCETLFHETASLLEPIPVALHWVVQPTPPVMGSQYLLRCLILHLISNSVQAHATDLTATLAVKNSQVSLTLRDNGTGIPPEALGTLWTPGEGLKGVHATGLGFGLTICQQIARRHHGSLLISSNPEGGCSCVLRLPADNGKQKVLRNTPVEYSGGFPDYMVELSGVLPTTLYDPEELL